MVRRNILTKYQKVTVFLILIVKAEFELNDTMYEAFHLKI